MQTNDFIKELEKVHSNLSELDTTNNLKNGFSIDREGMSLYEQHLNSLFIDYFKEIDDCIDKLLVNKSIDEIKLFINSKLTRFKTIKNQFSKWDNEYYLYHIKRLSDDIKQAEAVEWDEKNRYYQLYENKAIIRMKQHRSRLQLEYDFLTYKIDKVQFRIGLNEWETHEEAEDEGWDEEYIEQYFCLLRMERIGREYIDKSLQHLNDKHNFYLSTTTVQQNQRITEKEPTTKHPQIRQFTNEQKELLKTYFTSTFKGMGNNYNYFDENLIFDLQKNRTGKDYAVIAKIIYQSEKSNKEFKKKPFADWYNTFCSIMSIEKKTYKPSQIEITQNLKSEFYYL